MGSREPEGVGPGLPDPLPSLDRRWHAARRPSHGLLRVLCPGDGRDLGGLRRGFLENRPRTVHTDRDAQRWRNLVKAWHKKHTTYLVTTAHVLEIISQDQGLSEEFADILGDGPQDGRKTRLGKAIGRYQNRVFGESPSHAVTYRPPTIRPSGNSGATGTGRSLGQREAR